jgi:hypothetical protein
LTVSQQLSDYEAFRKAFLSTWWSTAHTNRQSNLSLSAYFLKYATMVSYLDPKPSDIKIIEAIRYHFPISVQRAMLSMQLTSIGEIMETQECTIKVRV